MDAGSVVTLTAEKPVAGGWMLARHDGAIVFVAGALLCRSGRHLQIVSANSTLVVGTCWPMRDTRPSCG